MKNQLNSRLSFRTLAAALIFAAAVPAAAKPLGASYDPEALLVLTVQKQSVVLLREELVRQAEWLELGAMKVMLAEKVGQFARNVNAGLTADSDILEDYREQILKVDPTAIGEADKLVAEIRRYHDLLPGKPMVRLPWPPPPGPMIPFLEEDGIGADAASALKGTPAMEARRYAERAGTTGPSCGDAGTSISISDYSATSCSVPKPYRRIYRLHRHTSATESRVGHGA